MRFADVGKPGPRNPGSLHRSGPEKLCGESFGVTCALCARSGFAVKFFRAFFESLENMKTLFVMYDLRAPTKNYERLWQRLGAWKAGRVLESTWVIQADVDAEVLRDDLSQFIDENDGLLVGEISAAAWVGVLQDPTRYFSAQAA